MRDINRGILGLAAAALIAAPAFAATPASDAQGSGSGNAAQQAANRDFGRFSHDGAKAFADIDLARLAIFNGQTTQAQQYVQQAETMLNKAKSDDTVFTKAESELKVPAGTAQRGPANATPSTTRVAWLPIGGTMSIEEDYLANQAKSAGVAKADAQMKAGNTQQAMETLKLHDVDVSFLEQVAPLQASLQGVEQASSLLAQNHYFAANQALKKVDDGVRIDEQSYVGMPQTKTASAAK